MNNSKWINFDNFTFFDNLSSTKLQNFKNIIIFDLDNTIIKTASGKVHPVNSDDWIFNFNNIVKKINTLDNTIIGIITNQKGINSQDKITKWQLKLNNIIKEINFHFVFASFKDDRYRKPMIGSWQYIKNNYLQGLDNIKNNEILFIGDACGRENDFSDTDIKFAYNCGFKFKTPEKFFNIKIPKQIASITYPILEYYTLAEYQKIINKIYEKFNNKKVLIMMIGLPSCGKSFLRKLIMNTNSDFKYYNKDDIKNKIINNNLLIKPNSSINYIIDDNTNLTQKNRNQILKEYATHYKIAIYFNYVMEVALHLNYMRMYWYGVQLIKKVAYYTLKKKIDEPIENDFDLFIEINKILPDFNFESNLKYFF